MPGLVDAVVFDVLETLFSLEPLRTGLEELGLKPESLELWFARTLRDGFALAASGGFQPFRRVAAGTLAVELATQLGSFSTDALDRLLDRFGQLPPHEDVEVALAGLERRNVRILALSNGARENTAQLLRQARLEHYFEQVLSIDDIQQWKPRPEVYLYAARQAGLEPARMALVAAHAWDLHGAKQIGMMTGWVRRKESLYHPALAPPDVLGDNLTDVCAALTAEVLHA